MCQCTSDATGGGGGSPARGAAEANVVAPPSMNARIALGDERVRELRARGADMDWDQAVAYTMTQTTQALDEFGSKTQP